MNKIVFVVVLLVLFGIAHPTARAVIYPRLATVAPNPVFYQSVFDRSGRYIYAPSIIHDTAYQRYRMFVCSVQDDWTGDQVYQANSTDLVHWQPLGTSLLPSQYSMETAGQPDGHVCDPSVIKVNGVYYMYYTAASYSGANNSIFLAKSTDGTNWSKYLTNTTPAPVINNTVNSGGYGIGQSSVMYIDGTFRQFYTDSDHGGVMYAKSTDGITWVTQNNGQPVLIMDNFAVTYLRKEKLFIGFRSVEDVANKGIRYFTSEDGITWGVVHTFFPHQLARSMHNVGVLTDEDGTIAGTSNPIYLYFAGGDGSVPSSWTIDLSVFSISLSLPSSLDAATCAQISGWACDPTAESSPVALTVRRKVDNVWQDVGTSVANNNSEGAVNQLCGDTPNHRFSFTIPDAFKTGNAESMSIAGVDSLGNVYELQGSPQTITCPAVVTSTPTPAPTTTLGYLGEASCSTISGWACDTSTTNPVGVRLFSGEGANQVFLVPTTAQNFSEDAVNTLCGGSANHRFSFDTPQSLKTGTNQVVHAYGVTAANTQFELNQSPMTINCPPSSSPSPTTTPKSGDLNHDGEVNIFDYNILIGDFGKTGTLASDINGSGRVDIFDYNLLISNFGK